MGVTQYTGARYVPLFAEPAEWNSTRTYEPLTIVIHEGNSYTSRQYVPKGIDIANEKFWALTGNYNAQVEQYRKDVLAFDDRITTNKDNINAEVTNRTNADKTLQDNINAEIARAKSAEESLRDTVTVLNSDNKLIIFGDSWTHLNSGDSIKYPGRVKWLNDIIDWYGNDVVKSYGVGGYTIPQFSEEIERAKNDVTPDTVKYVGIVGGVNGGTVNDANEFVLKVHNTFRNAKIVWFWNCWPIINVNGLWQYQASKITSETITACPVVNVVNYMGAVTGWFANESDYPEAHQHLSVKGSAVFEKLFIAGMFGGDLREACNINYNEFNKNKSYYTLLTSSDGNNWEIITENYINMAFITLNKGTYPTWIITTTWNPPTTGLRYFALAVKSDKLWDCIMPVACRPALTYGYRIDSLCEFNNPYSYTNPNITIDNIEYTALQVFLTNVTTGIGPSIGTCNVYSHSC